MSGQLFMLDTDIASYVIKGKSPIVDAHLKRLDAMQVCISAITRAELRFGVQRVSKAGRLAGEVNRFLSGIHTLAWNEAAADRFAEVRAELDQIGTPIGIMDTMIAAHAKAIDAVLVTNNLKHFAMVKGLAVENWTQ